MARLITTGFEIDFGTSLTLDGQVVSGSAAKDTGTFRSGAASVKCDSTGSNSAAYLAVGMTVAASRSYFCRGYMNFTALPTSTVKVFQIGGGTKFSAKLTSGGKLQLFNDNSGSQIGSDSAATLTTGQWYRLELKAVTNGSSQFTDVELRLDGATVASTSGLTIAMAGDIAFGWIEAPGASKVCYVDDVGANDSTASANTSWLGDGKVILMTPISDNTRGNWTAGAGGTTNLWDAVNATPPAGVADSSATNTSQIKIKSTSIPSSCDLNLDTYSNAGVGVGATVNALVLWCNDGEDPATGTKAGTAEIVSNPASGTVSFNFGDDVGAQGSYIGNWKWHSRLLDAPTVTLSSAPVVRVTCTSGSTGTRAASCDFLGVYVDYTPAATSFIAQPIDTELQAVPSSRLH